MKVFNIRQLRHHIGRVQICELRNSNSSVDNSSQILLVKLWNEHFYVMLLWINYGLIISYTGYNHFLHVNVS